MEVFEKVAATPSQVGRLQREAAVLRSVAHPGIVALISTEADRLRIRRVEGRSLDQVGPVPLPLLAGWAAAVATVVADLHHLGYVHGSLRADHVLIDHGGHPVLCGLGAARRPAPGADLAAVAHADVTDLVAMITSRLGPSAGEARLRRRLSRGCFDARTLARRLVQWVPGAYVGPVPADPVASDPSRPDEGPRVGADLGEPTEPDTREPVPVPAPGPARRWVHLAWWPIRLSGSVIRPLVRPFVPPRRRSTNVLVGVAAAGLVVVVVLLAAGGTRPSAPPQVSGPPASGVPAPARLVVPGPNGAYRLIADPSEQPVVTVGRWGCGPSRPAVLDERSGVVWVFAAWPGAGAQATGRLAGDVPGAAGMTAQPYAPGCDRLAVTRRSGGPVTLAVGR